MRLMTIWQHKETKKKYNVTPWWEMASPDEAIYLEVDMDLGKGITRKFKTVTGTLIQVGWLMSNEHGVWFGFSLDVEKQFKKVKDLRK